MNFERFLNQFVAVDCAAYYGADIERVRYRGILTEVNEEYLVLEDKRAIAMIKKSSVFACVARKEKQKD